MEDNNSTTIENIPMRIFKYYSFDPSYNKDRLTGNVYLASPLDFNDPNDCQLEVVNNTNSISNDEDWIKGKLMGLNISTDLDGIVSKLKTDDKETVEMVRKKQLENLGVLCLTQTYDNNIIWGYYTNNKGFCIEYDRELIITRLVIGFVNNLSWEKTLHLFKNKNYYCNPESRGTFADKKRIERANELFKTSEAESLTNDYLRDKNIDEKLCFLRNIYIKRFGGDLIKYADQNETHTPTLFYDRNAKSLKSKYYTKSKEWENEKEYRLTFSLGGRMVINLGVDCIKSISVSCNISILQIFEITSILSDNKMHNIDFIQMVKVGTCLKEKKIDVNELMKVYAKFASELKK